MADLIFLMVIGTSIWVYFDAKNIGVKKGQIEGIADAGPVAWFFGSLLLWIIVFPLYLTKRGQFILVNSPQKAEIANVKKCPDCAETIKQEAKVCRFCGAKFETA